MDTDDDDLQLALQVSAIESEMNSSESNYMEMNHNTSVANPLWELIDPTPNIHVLFIAFDKRFFWNKLSMVEVKWSSRMTLCAGLCRYEKRGGYCSISLSMPLLKLRPRQDLVETLLHEMIHAFLFVTHNFKDRDDHGPNFLEHMNRINKEGGTKITVYHSFHREVAIYKCHWWKCDGPCKTRSPFYGMVKRSMNRAPGPNDTWWSQHEAVCGGKFIKVKEPEGFGQKKSKKKPHHKNNTGNDLSQYFSKTGSPSKTSSDGVINRNPGSISGMCDISNKITNVSSDGSNRPVSQIHGYQGLKSNANTLVITKPDNNSSSNSNSLSTSGFKPFSGTGQTLGGLLDKSKSRLLFNFGDSDTRSTTSDSKPASTFKRMGQALGEASDQSNRAISSSTFKGSVKQILGGSSDKNDNRCLINFGISSTRSTYQTDDQSGNKRIKLSSTDLTEMQPSHVSNPIVEKITKLNEIVVINSDEEDDMINCPVCNLFMDRSDMSMHLENCTGLIDIFADNEVEDEDVIPEIDETNEQYVNCPCCNSRVKHSEINIHLDQCVNLSD